MDGLKNCPLCGGEAYYEGWKVRKGYEGAVSCTCCLLSLGSITYDTPEQCEKELKAEWNKRAGGGGE